MSKKFILAVIAMAPAIAFSAENPFVEQSKGPSDSSLEQRLNKIEQQSSYNESRLNELYMNKEFPSVPSRTGSLPGALGNSVESILPVIGEIDEGCLYEGDEGMLEILPRSDLGDKACRDYRREYLVCKKITCSDVADYEEALDQARKCGGYAKNLYSGEKGAVCPELDPSFLANMPKVTRP